MKWFYAHFKLLFNTFNNWNVSSLLPGHPHHTVWYIKYSDCIFKTRHFRPVQRVWQVFLLLTSDQQRRHCWSSKEQSYTRKGGFIPLYCRFEQLIDCTANKYKTIWPSNLFKLQPQKSGKAAYAHGQVAQQWQWRRCAHRACCSLCSGQTARKSSSTCGSAFSLGAAELETSWWLDSYLVPATDTWWGTG